MNPFKVGMLYTDRVFRDEVFMITKICYPNRNDIIYQYYYLTSPDRMYEAYHSSIEDIWIEKRTR